MTAGANRDLFERVDAVASDHLSGASHLARLAVEILIEARARGDDVAAGVAVALCRAQPAMALVWNAGASALGPTGVELLRQMGDRLGRVGADIGRVFTGVLLTRGAAGSEPVSLATLSASGSVRACLEAVARVRPLRVICAEGRPLYEGRRLAADLATAGVEVIVCTDAAAGTVLAASDPPVDAVVVGADAVTTRSVVNKCGTHGLACVAADAGVPTYVAVARDAFVGSALADRMTVGSGPAEEVWSGAPAGVTIANPYFERIPLDLVAALVTEVGPIGPGSVEEVCGSTAPEVGVERLVQELRRI